MNKFKAENREEQDYIKKQITANMEKVALDLKKCAFTVAQAESDSNLLYTDVSRLDFKGLKDQALELSTKVNQLIEGL